MDYVRTNPNAGLAERENISGVRVLDGEDQGKYNTYMHNINIIRGDRTRKQSETTTVIVKGLDLTITEGKRTEETTRPVRYNVSHNYEVNTGVIVHLISRHCISLNN